VTGAGRSAVGLVLFPEPFVFTRLLLLALLLGALGCGGTRDRGKNQDFDRPKATDKR